MSRVYPTARERSTVEPRAIVEVQDEHWRVGCRLVDLSKGWHAALSELKLAPAPNDAYPLRRRRTNRLFLEHAEGIGQRSDTIPPKLKVIVQPAANEVNVTVVQAGYDPSSAGIDHLRLLAAITHHLGVSADVDEAALPNSQRGTFATAIVERRNPGVPHD